MPICEVDIPVGLPYRHLTYSVALVPLSYAKKIQQKEKSIEKKALHVVTKVKHFPATWQEES